MNQLIPSGFTSRTTLWLASCLLILLPGSQSWAQAGQHHEAYLRALDKALVAEQRITEEMNRISSGTVAHYDFLQHEHIELLRHARALRHPPTPLEASDRDSIMAQTDALLVAAESLESVIADYLRAEAMLHSAISNTVDLIAMQPNKGLVTSELDRLQNLAAAAQAFQADNTSKTRAALESAFSESLELTIDPDWTLELSAQRQLIRSNAAGPADASRRLANSQVTQLAEALQATYLAAKWPKLTYSPMN